MANAIAYYRVSTKKQGQSGLGLQAQQTAVESYAANDGLTLVDSFTEVETGTNKRTRPTLQAAMKAAKKNDAVLLIAKLDRLAMFISFRAFWKAASSLWLLICQKSIT